MGRPSLAGNRKFKALAHRLGLPKPYARGLLETLWDTANEDGNPVVGSPELVEAAAEWPGEEGVLFTALSDLRWIDEESPGSWEIHDFWEHCPAYVRKRRLRELERKESGRRMRADQSVTSQRPPNGRTPAPAPAPREDLASPTVSPRVETSGEALVGLSGDKTDASSRRKALQAEIEWRLKQVWATHLLARERFFLSQNGKAPPGEPTLTKEIRAAIRDALKEHDGHRLREEDRDTWRKESPVRAAGIGIFLSQFHIGKSEKSEGATYLEPWRPWKRQRGKPDPVEMFAKFYFDDRGRRAR